MIPLILDFPVASSSPSLCFIKPSLSPDFRPISTTLHHNKKLQQRKLRKELCRAELSTDGTIGVAIGACILNSLVFPITSTPEDEGESVIDSTDARFAVMGIISFVPYFNWLSWLFAWLDTGKRSYAVYAIVYLAPYLRPNLSISPEDSWLPIASILLCIIHIQLEASIKNGDIQGFQLFSEAGKHNSSFTRKNNRISEEEEEKVEDHMNLPSPRDHYRNEIWNWGIPRSPPKDSDKLNEGSQSDGEREN